MTNVPAVIAQRIVEEAAGEGTTATAMTATPQLIYLLDWMEAVAGSEAGQAIERFWASTEQDGLGDVLWQQIDELALPFTAPLYLIVDLLYKLAPHVVEGFELTDEGRATMRAAVTRAREAL